MSELRTLDQVDKRILKIVQKDASLSIGEIAAQVGLSQTPCWKRLQKLESNGIIRRRIAVLDPIKIGPRHDGLRLDQDRRSHDRVAAAIRRARRRHWTRSWIFIASPEMSIMCCGWSSSDAGAFDDFYKKLIALNPLKNVTSHFALESIKAETRLSDRALERDEQKRKRFCVHIPL